jgi:cytochrome bd-type quinol oxidase subunit 2
VTRTQRRAGPAWLRLLVGLVLALAAVAAGLLGDQSAPEVVVVLCFALVLAGRGLLQLPTAGRRPRRSRRMAQVMVLVALAGVAVAVRALITDVPSEIPAPALVLIAALTLVVSVLVLALLPRESATS